MRHGVSIEEDDLGFYLPSCDCGWVGFPCPDRETAADVYGDHRASIQVPGE